MSTNEILTEEVFAGQIRPGDVIHEHHHAGPGIDRQTVWMTSHGPVPQIHHTGSNGEDGVRECAEWWALTVSSPRDIAPPDFDVRGQ